VFIGLLLLSWWALPVFSVGGNYEQPASALFIAWVFFFGGVAALALAVVNLVRERARKTR